MESSIKVENILKKATDIFLVLGLILVLPYIIAAPFLRDQGIFAWQAETLLRGGLPLMASWDVKAPSAAFTYALMFKIFGAHSWSVRLIDIGFLLTALWVVRRDIAQRFSPLRGNIFALSLLCLPLTSPYMLSQPDVWAGWILLIFFPLLMREKGSQWMWLSLGIAVGWMFGFKPLYALIALPLLWRAYEHKKAIIFMIGCTIIPLALLSLYALQGGLYALWEAVVLFNFNSHIQLQDSPVQLDTISAHSHIASIPVFTFPLYAIISYYIPLILFPLLGIVAGGLIFAQKRKNALCIVGLLLTGQLIIWAQPSESLYHPAPLCLLSMAILFYPPQTRRMAQLITSLFVLWVLSAAPYIVIEATRLIRSYDYTQMSAHDAAQAYGLYTTKDNLISLPDLLAASHVIQQETKAEDSVFVWGWEAVLYFYSHRPSASRIGFHYPLIWGAYQDQYRAELMHDLVKNKPSIFIVEKDDEEDLIPISSVAALDGFLPLRNLIDTNYRLIYKNNSYKLYKRIDLLETNK